MLVATEYNLRVQGYKMHIAPKYGQLIGQNDLRIVYFFLITCFREVKNGEGEGEELQNQLEFTDLHISLLPLAQYTLDYNIMLS